LYEFFETKAHIHFVATLESFIKKYLRKLAGLTSIRKERIAKFTYGTVAASVVQDVFSEMNNVGVGIGDDYRSANKFETSRIVYVIPDVGDSRGVDTSFA
jgi:hypothetical protein